MALFIGTWGGGEISRFSSRCSDLSHNPIRYFHCWYNKLLLIRVARSHRIALEECFLYIPAPNNPVVSDIVNITPMFACAGDPT